MEQARSIIKVWSLFYKELPHHGKLRRESSNTKTSDILRDQ